MFEPYGLSFYLDAALVDCTAQILNALSHLNCTYTVTTHYTCTQSLSDSDLSPHTAKLELCPLFIMKV